MSSVILDKFLGLFRPKKRAGLALSGGVARGFAHIGVLKALKRHNIPIQYIAGTSAGAMVGAFLAAGLEPEVIEASTKKLGWFRFLRLIPGPHGPLTVDEIKKFVIEVIGDKKFSDLKIPFTAVACDLKTGQEIAISEGKVAEAVAASSAFPGIFSPVEKNGLILVDGGLVNNLPSSAVKSMGADLVIAVDVVPGGIIKQDPQNAFQILGRSLDLIQKQLSAEGRKLADVVIEPKIPEDIWQLDINEAARLIKAGEAAAEKKILELKARLALN